MKGRDRSDSILSRSSSPGYRHLKSTSASVAPTEKVTCVCAWPQCAAYQKTFCTQKVPYWGNEKSLIELKLYQDEPEAVALKESIDRNLQVPAERRNQWKKATTHSRSNNGGSTTATYSKYHVARHHWTQKHIKRYEKGTSATSSSSSDRKKSHSYSFCKPFAYHGAKKYLYLIDAVETYIPQGSASSIHFDDDDDDDNHLDPSEALYLQCPNVPDSYVLSQIQRLETQQQQQHDSNGEATTSSDGAKNSNNEKTEGVHQHMPTTLLEQATQQVASLNKQLVLKDKENKNLRDQMETLKSHLHLVQETLRLQQEENKSLKKQLESLGPQLAFLHKVRRVPKEIALSDDDDSEPATTDEEDAEGFNKTAAEELYWTDGTERTVDDEATASTFPQAYMAQRRPSNGSRTSRTSSIVSHKSAMKRSSLVKENSNRASSFTLRNTKQQSPPKPQEHEDILDKSTSDMTHGSTHTDNGDCYDDSIMVTDPYGEKGTYSGAISMATGMPHGHGRLDCERAGRWYEGQWKHGRWHGHGKLSNGDGDFYEGNLKNDQKHGHGVMRFGDGRVFEGEYVNGQMVQGTMTYQDGSTYTGSWVDGVRHGKGRCVFTDKTAYEGSFCDGEFSGHGVMKFADGRTFVGDYKAGQMMQGRMTYQDGSSYTGSWVDGKRHGQGHCIFADKTVYNGEFRDGEFEGRGKMTWNDGGYYIGEWCNGEMHGRGKEVRKDGSLRHDGEWSKGQPLRVVNV